MSKSEIIEICLKPIIDKFITVFGFNAHVKRPDDFFVDVKNFFPLEIVQAVNADSIIDERFVKYAVLNTLTIKPKKWIADSSIRLLAFLACEKQIKDAVEKIGLKKNFHGKIAVIVVSDSLENIEKKVKDYVKSRKLKLLSREELFGGNHERIRKIAKLFNVSMERISRLRGEEAKKAISNMLVEEMAILSLKI